MSNEVQMAVMMAKGAMSEMPEAQVSVIKHIHQGLVDTLESTDDDTVKALALMLFLGDASKYME